MGDELEYLKLEIDSIAAAVSRMFPNVDQRFALVVYRDQGDEYVTRTFDFTASLGEFRNALARQFAAAGGDYPEAVHVAVEEAGRLSWRDRDTARVMFLVGDAPPHDEHLRRTLDGVLTLKAKGVRVFPVAASGVDRTAEFVLRATVFLTLGQYLFLTDHSGVGNPHAEPHALSYEVEHLSRLMVRMIASELAGKRLAPNETIDRRGEQAAEQPQRGAAQAAAYHHSPSRPRRAAATWFDGVPGWVWVVLIAVSWCLIENAIERRSRIERATEQADEPIDRVV